MRRVQLTSSTRSPACRLTRLTFLPRLITVGTGFALAFKRKTLRRSNVTQRRAVPLVSEFSSVFLTPEEVSGNSWSSPERLSRRIRGAASELLGWRKRHGAA